MEEHKSESNDTVTWGLFAASNSANGFKSYYSEIFGKREYEKVYVIKGGPGTGKSRFMSEVSRSVRERGHEVEHYYCSSDPDSLDGIIIDNRIVILDGTPPHSYEGTLMGARDELIDLGSFWDSEKLYDKADEIERLVELKSEHYKKAYKYLEACGSVDSVNAKLMLSALKHKKMESALQRLISLFEDEDKLEITPSTTDSIGMKGRVKFDTYEKSAEKLYYVIDCYNSARFYLSLLITMAKQKNISMRISYEPISCQYPDCVYFYNKKTAFVIVDKDDSERADAVKINMKRFIDHSVLSDIKKELKCNKKLYEGLLSSAVESLVDAGNSHFELEKIYSSCMDFDAKERYTVSFCEKLLNFLEKKV